MNTPSNAFGNNSVKGHRQGGHRCWSWIWRQKKRSTKIWLTNVMHVPAAEGKISLIKGVSSERLQKSHLSGSHLYLKRQTNLRRSYMAESCTNSSESHTNKRNVLSAVQVGYSRDRPVHLALEVRTSRRHWNKETSRIKNTSRHGGHKTFSSQAYVGTASSEKIGRKAIRDRIERDPRCLEPYMLTL